MTVTTSFSTLNTGGVFESTVGIPLDILNNSKKDKKDLVRKILKRILYKWEMRKKTSDYLSVGSITANTWARLCFETLL